MNEPGFRSCLAANELGNLGHIIYPLYLSDSKIAHRIGVQSRVNVSVKSLIWDVVYIYIHIYIYIYI